MTLSKYWLSTRITLPTLNQLLLRQECIHLRRNFHARFLPEFNMKGKVCVITGGARGLGNTMAGAFIESGCNAVAILDLKQDDAERAAIGLVQSSVGSGIVQEGEINVIGVGCDVASEPSVQEAMGTVIDTFGTIDTLVTAAGIVENFRAVDYPTEKIRKLYDINVHGSFFCAREVAKHMISRGKPGSIVLVASMSATIVNSPQFQTPYNASKAAVKHMAASLAVEWAKHGIRVNALSPGYMLTPLTKAVLANDPTLKKFWENATPMGQMGLPDDLKGAIVFLGSNASRFMTGSELNIDGGYRCL